jgi:hypothetical protein
MLAMLARKRHLLRQARKIMHTQPRPGLESTRHDSSRVLPIDW